MGTKLKTVQSGGGNSPKVCSFTPMQAKKSTTVPLMGVADLDPLRRLIPLNGKLPSHYTEEFQSDIFELFDELEASIAKKENPDV